MAVMLEVLILRLKDMNEESSQLGLEINWSRTKIQASESIQGSSVLMLDLVDTVMGCPLSYSLLSC